MTVEFGLLGDIEARIDGRAIDLGHARQRCVLAVLLVDLNKIVQVEQLLERVWGQRRPQRAQNALYSYLSRLRRSLGEAPDADVVRQPGGYVLAADPGSVDLHRFHDLLALARATEDDKLALGRFDEAIGLWRGVPFGYLDTPWSNNLREVLEQERLAAELDRTDAALRCGQDATLLPDLSQRAAELPLDERLAGQLMLALYRAGRQADALDHYARLRHQLADAMGVDPGPDLQDLHLRILGGDRALAAPVTVRPPAAPAAPRVPQQLPTPPPLFAGRARELAALDTSLGGRSGAQDSLLIAAIGGAGGIGKSWLALRWAHDNLDRFPDGQLYVNLRGFDPSAEPMPPAVALRGFLDALGAAPESIPADLDAQAGLYRTLVSGQRILIVLDNAHDTEQVVPLLPGSPTCSVLVTSRRRLGGLVTAHGARAIALDVLSSDDAYQLLSELLGADRAAAEPESVATILGCCAGLPLALGIVAARAAMYPEFPLAGLADELSEQTTRLNALDAGELTANLRAVFDASYRALRPETAEVFGMLGLPPGPDISLPAIASLAGRPPARTSQLLQELHQAHLVQQYAPGRYRLHDLVRLYAAERADQELLPVARQEALRRLLDHYLRAAHLGGGLLNQQRDMIALPAPVDGVTPERLTGAEPALAWFNREHAALLGALDRAVDAGFDAYVWQLAWALEDFLDRQGHWHDWAMTQRMALKAAGRLGERPWQAYAHHMLGMAYVQLGCLDDAERHQRGALEIYEELGDLAKQADSHRSLGWVLEVRGRPQEAFPHCLRSLELYRQIGHRAGQAMALNNAGWLHVLLGDYQAAIECCEQAVAINQELGDLYSEAGGWDSLGYAYHHLGDYDRAIECYQRALVLNRTREDLFHEPDILLHLGDTYLAAGDVDAARGAFQEALALQERTAHPNAKEVKLKLDQLDQPS